MEQAYCVTGYASDALHEDCVLGLPSVAFSSQGIRLDPYMVCVDANGKVKPWPTILIKEHLQNFVSLKKQRMHTHTHTRQQHHNLRLLPHTRWTFLIEEHFTVVFCKSSVDDKVDGWKAFSWPNYK